MHARLCETQYQALREAAHRHARALLALSVAASLEEASRARYNALLVRHGFNPNQSHNFDDATRQVIPDGLPPRVR